MTPDVTLDATAVEELTRRSIPVDTPMDSWPIQPPDIDIPRVLDLARWLLAEVASGSGLSVVRWPTDNLDDHGVCTVGWNLFTLLCQPVPQYRTGELIYPVEVDDKVAEVSHYSGSNRSGGHHTDGTLLSEPPNIACLFGLSAANGGETVIMDGIRLCELLAEIDPVHVETLSRQHHFDVQGQIDGIATKQQPVIRRTDGEFELRYLRRYIENGYRIAGVPLPGDLRAAMDRFDALSSDEANQTPLLLDRGVALIWNNCRMLHGRRTFREGTSKRRLRRLYGRYAADRPTSGHGGKPI